MSKDKMPDEIWVTHYPDDGHTGEFYHADTKPIELDKGHVPERYHHDRKYQSAIMKPPTLAEQDIDEAAKEGTVKAICPLDEGSAILILPKNLSKASYEDLEYWFKGELRKAARKAKVEGEETDE